MDIKEIREQSGMSRKEFAETYEIPIRSLENWESGARKCPKYMQALLERAVIEDKKVGTLKCYDESVLRELGYCYKSLLYVLNKEGNDPFSSSEIFPVKCFVMVFMRASTLGIPKELDSRIGMLLNNIELEDWGNSMSIPAPSMSRMHFMMGMSDRMMEKKIYRAN